MGVKVVEYTSKWEHNLVPGPNFFLETHDAARGGGQETPTLGRASSGSTTAVGVGQGAGVQVNQQQAQMFFGIYFATTGLHAMHILIGVILMAVLGGLITFGNKAVQDYMTLEMVGLYWHFVDIVWIFLYPLLYLINPVI